MKAQLVKENINFKQPESEEEFQADLFSNTKKATKRIINNVWTIEYKIIGDRAKIIKYSRDDEEGYEREKELPMGEIKEGEDRIADKLVIWDNWGPNWKIQDPDKIYDIINKKHIFSYKG